MGTVVNNNKKYDHCELIGTNTWNGSGM